MQRIQHVVLNLVLLAISLVGGLATATQRVAAAYEYHRGLGAPVFRLGETPVYAPWRFLVWRFRFGHQAPDVFENAQTLGFGVFAAVAAVIVLLVIKRANQKKPSATHGTARWATAAELKKANLLNGAGVVLCQTHDARFDSVRRNGSTQLTIRRFGELIRHDGPEHVMCFAPTRSGKGVGLVVPTLLTWPASVIAWDVKRELWHLTAGFRHGFSYCWRFEPTDMESTRYNPLLEIRRGQNEVRDTQAVADMLVDPDGTKEKDHWALTAHSLLVGAILHVLYVEEDKSLAGVARFLSDPQRSQYDTLERMLSTKHLGHEAHPVVAGAAREMMNKADNELSGVFSTAMSTLGLYRDPVVARATSASDFRIADLMRADKPASLYLVVAPSDLDRLRPLMRLVINQIGRRLSESNTSGGGEAYKHRLLWMLDEFPTLGKMAFFESALAYFAGYGMKAFLISQDLNQLDARYGDKNSILANCHVRIAYGANDDATAERISKLLGQATHQSEQVSHSGDRFGLLLKQASKSTQETARPLLTPGEILQLPPQDALLFVGGIYPYRAKKVLYYEDPKFKERAAIRPPTAKELQWERIRSAPSDWETPAIPAKRAG
jgi:type IV secretion system protein VirD4